MYYFAYGSNLSQERLKARCPGSKPLFPTTLPNYRLLFTERSDSRKDGTATIQSGQGAQVKGGVYEITDSDLTKLDKHEGCHIGIYKRIDVTVFDKENKPLKAVTYIKCRQMKKAEPSEEYLSFIQQGYKDWYIE